MTVKGSSARPREAAATCRCQWAASKKCPRSRRARGPSIEIDGIHNLALLRNGHVMAWGGDKDGALGDESEGGISATPVEVSHLTDATSIAAGARDGFAVGPPVPMLTSLEPSIGYAEERVEITGTNLAGATSVQFGSVSTERDRRGQRNVPGRRRAAAAPAHGGGDGDHRVRHERCGERRSLPLRARRHT